MLNFTQPLVFQKGPVVDYNLCVTKRARVFLHTFDLLVGQVFPKMLPEFEQTLETVTAGVTNKLSVPDVQVAVTEGRLLRDHVGHSPVTLGLEVAPDGHVADVGGVDAPLTPSAQDAVLTLPSEVEADQVSVRVHSLKPRVLNMIYSSLLENFFYRIIWQEIFFLVNTRINRRFRISTVKRFLFRY